MSALSDGWSTDAAALKAFCDDCRMKLVNITVSFPPVRTGPELNLEQIAYLTGWRKVGNFTSLFVTSAALTGRNCTISVFKGGGSNMTGPRDVVTEALIPCAKMRYQLLQATAALGAPCSIRVAAVDVSNYVFGSRLPFAVDLRLVADNFPGCAVTYIKKQYPGVRCNVGGDHLSGCIPPEINTSDPNLYATIYERHVVVTGASTMECAIRAHAHTHYWLRKITADAAAAAAAATSS